MPASRLHEALLPVRVQAKGRPHHKESGHPELDRPGNGVKNIIMCDSFTEASLPAPVGQQIRRLRLDRRWSLAELARRAGTSGPALHRYESGWDRFELATLRKIAAALGARLDVRLVPRSESITVEPRSWRSLVKLIAPLFWDQDLGEDEEHPDWVLGRVLAFGNREQVTAARAYFGDAAIRRVIKRRGVDARTRNYWKLIL